jgi:hypothetical protein
MSDLKHITVDDIIYGINKSCIQGYGDYHTANITGANAPLPVPRYSADIVEDGLGELMPDHVYPITLQRYLNGRYLEKSNLMNGFRNDPNFEGRKVQTAAEYITKNFNINYAGYATNDGSGAFGSGFLKDVMKPSPPIVPVGTADGAIPDIPDPYTVTEPNPFPVRTDASLK